MKQILILISEWLETKQYFYLQNEETGVKGQHFMQSEWLMINDLEWNC